MDTGWKTILLYAVARRDGSAQLSLSFPPVRIIASALTFFCNTAGLRTLQFLPQDRIQGTISSSEFNVILSSKVPSVDSWIR
jgi:hypothetical protein